METRPFEVGGVVDHRRQRASHYARHVEDGLGGERGVLCDGVGGCRHRDGETDDIELFVGGWRDAAGLTGGGGIGGDFGIGIGEGDCRVDGVGDPPTHLPGTDDE